jgi:uncharacterized delta-60 repeat protein
MHRISRVTLVSVVLAAAFAALGPAHGVATFSAPVIDYPPTPQATVAGGTVHFTVIAHGTPPLTYQWRKDGTNLDGGGTVSGATADTLTLAGVGGADAAGYSVVVSNASGSATSADAALSVTSPQAGDVDLSFGAGLSRAEGWAVALQPDGKILVGGKFALLNGTPRNNIARLNADGSLDHTFANALAGPNGRVFCLAVQPDGRVLIGGQFTTVNGVSRGHIARLNADGSLDTTFLNGLTGVGDDIYEPYVRTLALQTDGRVLIGGIFVTINGVSRQNIARLNADGSLDTTFQHLSFAGASSSNGPSVQSIALQSDGRVLIGGEFFLLNDLYSNGIARLNFDGSRDTIFTQLTG